MANISVLLCKLEPEAVEKSLLELCPTGGLPSTGEILLFDGCLGFRAVSCLQCSAELLPCSRRNGFRDAGGARFIPALPCVF